MDTLCQVRPSVRPSVRLCCRVRSINPILIKGFSSILAEIFTSTRGCAELILPMCQLKVKITIEGQISINQTIHSMSCPLCKSNPYWKSLLISDKCSHQQGDVQNSCYPFAGLRSMSHLKVKQWLRKYYF